MVDRNDRANWVYFTLVQTTQVSISQKDLNVRSC